MPDNVFPDNVPEVASRVRVTFPNSMVVETFVRQRSVMPPDGQIQIHLWGKNFEQYSRMLDLKDGEWFTSLTDDVMSGLPMEVKLVELDT
ncbi:hypothetical protein KKB10_06200 [Patescibacteria group bacterium]|nr:hypothetical protein [Patescibacteria group bacterium]MBU1075589.1 hypothetical protein [Patescibacteria group bacterium]MBU1952126.1 hypothetical protein [Patescibacteria group bacterium]